MKDEDEIVIKVITPTLNCDIIDLQVGFASPSEGAEVPYRTYFVGSVNEVPPQGCDLWLVAFSFRNAKFQPQPLVLEIDTHGQWRHEVFLGIGSGADQSVGDTFNIYAILTDSEESRVFRDYLEVAGRIRDWPGINMLPRGSIVVGQVRNIVRIQGAE